MPSTGNQHEMPSPNQISRQTGRHEDNAFKVTKANNHNVKGSDRHPLTPPPHQDHGTTNQFQWISIKLECQEEIGEGEGEVRKEGT